MRGCDEQELNLSIGDKRAVEAMFTDIGHVIAREIEAAEADTKRALEEDHVAYLNAQKLVEAGWGRALAAVEALRHSAEVQLTTAAVKRDALEQRWTMGANQLGITKSAMRDGEMQQIATLVVNRLVVRKEQIGPPPSGDWLDRIDQFVAGWAHTFTFGTITKAREWIYGDIATRNHRGTLFNVGQVAGVVHGVALGFGLAGAVGNSVRTGQAVSVWITAGQYYVMYGNIMGIGTSTYHLFNGTFRWYHALGFVPAIGYIGNSAGRVMRIHFMKSGGREPFHTIWGIGDQFVHGGKGWGSRVWPRRFRNQNQMIDYFARETLKKTPFLPVLFPKAALKTDVRCVSCLTAAFHGFFRGWFPFI